MDANQELKIVSYTMDDETKRKLRILAAHHGVSMSAYLRSLVVKEWSRNQLNHQPAPEYSGEGIAD